MIGPDGRQRFPAYQNIDADQFDWSKKLLLRNLKNAVRTRERAVFAAYCGDLAERRFQEGYPGQQVCDALRMLNQICFKALLRDPEAAGLKSDMIDHITLTLRRLRSCAGGVRGAGDVVGPDSAGGLPGTGG